MAPVSLAHRLAPASAVLPRRRRGREPDALGPAARDQGLPGDGPPPGGGPRVPLHDQPGAEPAGPARGVRRRGHRHPPDALAPPGRRPGPGGRLRDPRHVLHGLPGHDDPAASALPGALPDAVVVEQLGQAGPRPFPPARPPRPPGLVEPGVGPPARSSRRTPSWPSSRPRAGTTPRRRSSGSWTSSDRCWPGDPPASRAGRTRPGGADHDAVLSPDPAPPARQDAGPGGDAGRHAAGLPRRVSRGCGGARPPRRREPRRAIRRAAARACGPARARSARR